MTKKSSELSYYMRMAYEEFGNVLINKIIDDNPKDFKTIKKVEKAMKNILDKEFGKDKGGVVDL